MRSARGCRKLTMRSVVVESAGGVLAGVSAAPGPVGLGFKFTAAIVPSWVPISKSVCVCATDSVTKFTLSRGPEPRERSGVVPVPECSDFVRNSAVAVMILNSSLRIY